MAVEDFERAYALIDGKPIPIIADGADSATARIEEDECGDLVIRITMYKEDMDERTQRIEYGDAAKALRDWARIIVDGSVEQWEDGRGCPICWAYAEDAVGDGQRVWSGIRDTDYTAYMDAIRESVQESAGSYYDGGWRAEDIDSGDFARECRIDNEEYLKALREALADMAEAETREEVDG